jgi:hypothetical protein
MLAALDHKHVVEHVEWVVLVTCQAALHGTGHPALGQVGVLVCCSEQKPSGSKWQQLFPRCTSMFLGFSYSLYLGVCFNAELLLL